MTDEEIGRLQRRKWAATQVRNKRRWKLKRRYGHRLAEAIWQTREKLAMLIELKTEEEQSIINGPWEPWKPPVERSRKP